MRSRFHLNRTGTFVLVAGCLALSSAGPFDCLGDETAGKSPPAALEPEQIRPDSALAYRGGPVAIHPPTAPPSIPDGRGRMSIVFDGNRRWCTFADDRMARPPLKTLPGLKRRKEVYTFGYQFSIAAFERSDPSSTLLLFASPVIRTASLRQAGKLGRGWKDGVQPPTIAPSGEHTGIVVPRETPASIVPYWEDKNRCAVVGEQFDFDLGPGTYDVYVAFDLMMRSGAWVHRSYGYLTGIRVEEGRRTKVDGVIDTRGGGNRSVDLLAADVLPPEPPEPARH